MDNRPPFDREFLIPILLSGFSVIGIVIVLVIGRAMNAPAQMSAPELGTYALAVTRLAPKRGR